MLHRVDLTGDNETTIYDAARRLLAEGASERDRVETYRKDKSGKSTISMAGQVGWCAQWRVVFKAKGPCLEAYQGPPLGGPAPKTAGRAIGVAEVAIVGGNGVITRA